MNNESIVYVGFWLRTWALILDSLLEIIIVVPILLCINLASGYSIDTSIDKRLEFLILHVYPAIVVILFWIYKSATPGKMAIRSKIVDANTGDAGLIQ